MKTLFHQALDNVLAVILYTAIAAFYMLLLLVFSAGVFAINVDQVVLPARLLFGVAALAGSAITIMETNN